MPNVSSYKSVMGKYAECSPQVLWYFDQFPKLLPNFPYEVALAYLFLRTERAHNRALYCGAVKLHRTDSVVTDSVVNAQHINRDTFLDLYSNIFGHPLSDRTRTMIQKAEKVRDKVIHGKEVRDRYMREALVDVLEYAEALNADTKAVAGFEPFGQLKGFKGRGMALSPSSSSLILKGLGFSVSLGGEKGGRTR